MILFFPLQAHFIQCADFLPFNIIILGIIPCVSLTLYGSFTTCFTVLNSLILCVPCTYILWNPSDSYSLKYYVRSPWEYLYVLSLTPLLTVTPYPFFSHTLNLTPTQLRTYHPELGMPYSYLVLLIPAKKRLTLYLAIAYPCLSTSFPILSCSLPLFSYTLPSISHG